MLWTRRRLTRHRHDGRRALGCTDTACSLCAHNPHRRCSVNFDRKYLVHDPLRAKCGAGIRVELISKSTGKPLADASGLVDLRLEVQS